VAALLITTALTQVEQALRDAILLGYGRRLTPAAADTTALKAMASNARSYNDLRYVTSKGYVYEWSPYSTATDDGDAVLKPTDNPTAGRWLKTASTATTGYLRAVELYEGESDAVAILSRLSGVKPAVVIVFDGADHVPKSQIAGALYDWRPGFNLWCVSSNLRPQHQTAVGSDLSAEAAADPGTNRLVGDLKKLLAGNSLGLTGVRWVEIGREERAYTNLGDRLMVYTLRVKVLGTIENPDDPADLTSITSMEVQRGIVDLNEQASVTKSTDPLDAAALPLLTGVADGAIHVPVGASLTQTITAGRASIAGTVVNYTGAAHTFAASVDTYRDLSTAGALTFVAVAHGNDEPAVTANCLRIGCTVTDASGVTSDRYICATVNTFGDLDTFAV
jgi:hypothetical protein